MRRIVIFGGGGFIGGTFTRMFAEQFERIVVVDRFCGPAHPRTDAYDRHVREVDPERVVTVVADAAQSDALGAILASADAVMLLNADTGTANSFLTPGPCVRENVTTLLAAAEAIRKFCRKGDTRIVFTSSRAVYGEGSWRCQSHGPVALDRSPAALEAKRFEPVCPRCCALLELAGTVEDALAMPLSVYGATKRAGEDLLRTVLGQDGFDLRIVRFQNVFGPGQEVTNPYTGVLNWFSTQMERDELVEIYERGHIRRDFIFVEDAAQLLMRLLVVQRPPSQGALILNGGSGNAATLLEVARMLKDRYGSRSEIVQSDKYRVGDVLGARADMSRARTLLRFQCSVTLQDGLARYAKWFSSLH